MNNSTLASPTIQQSTLKTQHCAQRIACHFRQTATSEVIVCIYGCAIECLYDEQGNEAEVWYFKSPSMIYDIRNKQVKFLTSQYIGTCKSAYTKGYALN